VVPPSPQDFWTFGATDLVTPQRRPSSSFLFALNWMSSGKILIQSGLTDLLINNICYSLPFKFRQTARVAHILGCFRDGALLTGTCWVDKPPLDVDHGFCTGSALPNPFRSRAKFPADADCSACRVPAPSRPTMCWGLGSSRRPYSLSSCMAGQVADAFLFE
jgi:hypothetical protein